MTQKYYYPAVFQPEATGYSVFVPDIPGCCTEGLSMPEAIAMTEDAIGLMLEGIKEENFPKASSPESIPLEEKQFVVVVPFDKLAYDRKYNQQPIEKTIAIPGWLDALARERNVNFSGVFQNALMRELNIV